MTTILVVDDEVMIALAVESVLTAAGYAVVLAHDGLSALEMARAERPACVVTDHMMPRMSGLELAEAMRSEPGLRDVPLVMTSAVLPASPAELAAVFRSVLIKPYRLDDVLAAVEAAAGPPD